MAAPSDYARLLPRFQAGLARASRAIATSARLALSVTHSPAKVDRNHDAQQVVDKAAEVQDGPV